MISTSLFNTSEIFQFILKKEKKYYSNYIFVFVYVLSAIEKSFDYLFIDGILGHQCISIGNAIDICLDWNISLYNNVVII